MTGGGTRWSVLAGCATAAYFALIRLVVGDVLGPDNEAYAAYVAEWWDYSQWTAPKPLEVAVIGVLHSLTGSTYVAGFAFDAAMGVLVGVSCQMIARFGASLAATVVFVAAIVCSPFFVNLLARGGSGILSTALVFVAIERIVAKRIWLGTLGRVVVVLPLLLAALSRPEHWITAPLVAALLFWWKYRACGLSSLRLADGFLLLPLMAPLVWMAFDMMAFGDPFYTAYVTRGYVDNVRFVFGWSAPVSLSQVPSELGAFLGAVMPTSWALLAIPGMAYAFWLDRPERGHLASLIAIPALTTCAVYVVSTVVEGMAMFARFFVLDYVVVLMAASVGFEGVIRVLGSIEPRRWHGAGRIVLVGLALGVLAWPGWQEALPTWWRFERDRTEKQLHDEAARLMEADRLFNAGAYVVVPARSAARYVLRLPVKPTRVFAIRQLAELEGHPLSDHDIIGLMRAMEPLRRALMFGQRQKLAGVIAPAQEAASIVYLVVSEQVRSSRTDAVVSALMNQAATVTPLNGAGRVRVYRLVSS